MSPADDTELLTRPDRTSSIESLIAVHDRDVRSALRRVLGRSQEEDDLVQEVFTRLVVRLRQPGDLCVGAWLRGVAHNLAVDEIRRRRPVPVEETRLDQSFASPADDVVAGSELYTCLVDGAKRLPERQRAALAASLSGNGAAGVAAVASTLGVSVHAAESLLSRARFGLRSHLAGAGAGADADRGSVRVSLGLVLAGLVATVGWLARRWRAVTVVALAGGALTLSSATLLPALGDSPDPVLPSQSAGAVAGAAAGAVAHVPAAAGAAVPAPGAVPPGAGATVAADGAPATGSGTVEVAPPAPLAVLPLPADMSAAIPLTVPDPCPSPAPALPVPAELADPVTGLVDGTAATAAAPAC